MKTLIIEIDPATLSPEKRTELCALNSIYHEGRDDVAAIENRFVTLNSNDMVRYHVVVDDESPTYEGDAFFKEDFLCGIMDVLDGAE